MMGEAMHYERSNASWEKHALWDNENNRNVHLGSQRLLVAQLVEIVRSNLRSAQYKVHGWTNLLQLNTRGPAARLFEDDSRISKS